MKTAEEIKHITEELLKGSELFLVDITVSSKNVIEVFIDSMNGVNVSSCIQLSKKLDECLDREEEDFELTVSSAGIGYPFKVAGQYQKNIDKKVEVILTDGTKLTGILKAYQDKQITLEYEEKVSIEGKKRKEAVKREKDIALTDIKQAKDIVSF